MTNEAALASQPIRCVMDANVLTAATGQPVHDLARDLLAHGLSGLPVVDDAGALIGIVSELDVLTKRGATVGEVMSRGVISVAADASIDEAIRLMGLHGIRLLPVLDGGRLVGVVSRADLLRQLVGGDPSPVAQ